MRFVSVCLLWLAAVTVTSAADVELTRVQPGWRDAASFERILEYFTGREHTGGQTILRTHADQRAGFYFLVRLKNSVAAVPAAKFSLQVITPTDPLPKTFSFPAALPTGTSVFNLGLTGADWTDTKNPPVAWKLELLADDGRVLASAKSYLWEKPAP